MYIEILKRLYYEERKKLEEMEIGKEEGRLRLLKLRKDIANDIQDRLNVPAILQRTDITDGIKDGFIRENESKIEEELEKVIDDELTEIENGLKEELRDARYTAGDYVRYLYQAEKVQALEAELGVCRLFPDEVYFEQKNLSQEK
jgi:uncharacterized membrane protein YgaE (UPF0421/DUF939 family)